MISLDVVGISDLLNDALVGATVLLELVKQVTMILYFIPDILQMIFGYIDFSFFAKALVGTETVALPIAYLLLVVAFIAFWTGGKVMGFVDKGVGLALSSAGVLASIK